MLKKIILLGVYLSCFVPILGMESNECLPNLSLKKLSIQDLIDRGELPPLVAFEFGDGNFISGYIFSQLPLTSLEGLENLPEIENVRVLEFEENTISRISAQDFEAVPNLVSLKIKYNPLQEISPKAFDKLSHLKLIRLENLPLSHLPKGIFDNQHELEKVLVAHCNLQRLPEEIFKNSATLHALDLRHNKMTEFSAELVQHLDQLIGINLTYNKLETISPGVVLAQLQTLSLKGNPITHLSPEFVAAVHQKEIWTGLKQEIFPIRRKTIHDMIEKKTAPRVNTEFRYLNLNGYLLTSLEGLERIENIEIVENLSATHNYLDEIPLNLWKICPHLHTLNLLNNRISVLRDRPYDECSTNEQDNLAFIEIPLKELILQSNDIERIEVDAFHRFQDLEELNLHNNRIGALHAHALRGLFVLQDLDLSENKLTAIDEKTFKETPYLNFVDLSNNKLTRIPSFGYMNGKTNLEVYLTHNYIPDSIPSVRHSNILFFIGQQKIPKLKLLMALKFANAFARTSIEMIINVLKTNNFDSGVLELIFEASTTKTKNKIIEAQRILYGDKPCYYISEK